MKGLFYTLIFLVAGLLGGAILAYISLMGYSLPVPNLGSSVVGNDCVATSTPTFAGGASWTDQVIKLGSGTLCSVIITAAGTEKFILYDATSTGSLTTGNFDSRNRVLAHVETSQVAGTYVYDVGFNYGLILDHLSGTSGTTTITFR